MGKFKEKLLDKSDSTMIQFLRSLVVGGIATAVDIGVAMLFVYAFKMNEQLAAAIGFIFGLAVNYLLSALWIFEKSKVTNRLGEFITFAVIGAIGLAIKLGLITLFEWLMRGAYFETWVFANLNELIRNGVATVLVFVYNFAARKLILYRNNTKSGEAKQQ